MSAKDNGGSAFPEIVTYLGSDRDTNKSYSDVMSSGGMTLRDYAVVHLLAAIIDTEGAINDPCDAESIDKDAARAGAYADAMLRERAR